MFIKKIFHILILLCTNPVAFWFRVKKSYNWRISNRRNRFSYIEHNIDNHDINIILRNKINHFTFGRRQMEKNDVSK